MGRAIFAMEMASLIASDESVVGLFVINGACMLGWLEDLHFGGEGG